MGHPLIQKVTPPIFLKLNFSTYKETTTYYFSTYVPPTRTHFSLRRACLIGVGEAICGGMKTPLINCRAKCRSGLEASSSQVLFHGWKQAKIAGSEVRWIRCMMTEFNFVWKIPVQHLPCEEGALSWWNMKPFSRSSWHNFSIAGRKCFCRTRLYDSPLTLILFG